MPDASFQVTSFLGGEFSQAMQGRMDDPRYKVALNVCLNALMLESGAWVRRPGFKFAGRTPSGKPARVIPFNFTSAVPYSMEFSDGILRFRQGASFVMINGTVNVHSISTAKPAVVRTLQPHLAQSGNWIAFANLGTSCPTLQNRQFIITVVDSYHFSIADDVEGAIDGSLLGSLPSGVTVQRVEQINTSYVKGTSNDWTNLRVIQAETQALLLNGQAPNIITVVTQPSAGQFATFDYRAVNFVDGPYLDPYNGNDMNLIAPTSVGLTQSGSGPGPITFTAARLNGSAAPDIFVSTDVGRQIRLFSAPPTWLSTGSYPASSLVIYNGQVFQNTSGGTLAPGGKPDTAASQWGLQSGLRAFWVYGTITSVVSTTQIQVQILGPGNNQPIYTTPIEMWRLGVYSNTTGWPTCGCYHEGRVWLGGAITNRFDASISNGLSGNVITMSPTDLAGNVSSGSGISYIMNAKDVNQLLWMEPDQQGIVCGTKGGEWLIQATSQNLPLSPTNIQAHRYTTTGCANIEPRRTPLTLVFVQKYVRKIMELFPDVFSGRFTAPNLTETAKHLTVSGIAEMAYQQELSPTLWVRRGDGKLIGCTYKRENLRASDVPNFAAWHRHTLGSGRTIESICASGNADGTLETLVAVTNDPATNIRWVEVMSDLLDETAGLTDAWFVDGSVAPSSYQISIVNDTPTALTLNGLWHLNGKTVTVWAGGLDAGDWPVANGSISVPFGDGVNSGPNGTSDTTGSTKPGGGGYLLTPAYVNGFAGSMPIAVGFTYTSQGQMVRPNAREDTGARNGPAFGKKRLGNMIAMLVVNTQGMQYGTDFSRMQPAYFRTASGRRYAVNEMFTGVFWDALSDDWSYDSRLAWQVTRPYPVTLASIGGFLKTNDY